MSENTNEPELPESDKELESLLQNLKPDAMDVRFLDTLHRDYQLTAAETTYDPTRPQWRRVIPLTIACVVAMAAYASFRFGPELRKATEVAENGMKEVALPVDGPSADNFVPVSAQGYLVNAASGGVIETEQGPRERLTVEYEDAYHWHDPNTGTNIRFFQPRNEEIIVPLQTD